MKEIRGQKSLRIKYLEQMINGKLILKQRRKLKKKHRKRLRKKQ